MKKFIISTDSTADLPLEYVREKGIEYLPLNFIIESKEYSYKDDLDLKTYYDKMREGASTTTMQANFQDTYDAFEKYAKEDIDILHISFSSALSGTFSTETLVAREVMDKYPSCKIAVIDSLAASGGQGILVRRAVEAKERGMDIDGVIEYIEDLKKRVTHYFTVEDMKYLQRGGRVSKTKAIIANVVNLKPILHCDDQGKLVALTTERGRKKSIKSIYKLFVENQGENFKLENPYIVICDADCRDDAIMLGEMIKENFYDVEIKYEEIGPTIGAHSGPGTIALYYIGEHR